MIKVSPSSLTWTEGGMNAASFNSQCWRFIKYTQGEREEIHPLYQLAGAAHEHFHMRELELCKLSYEREVAFKIQTDDYVVSGRCDFKLTYSIDECKSSLKPIYPRDLPKVDHTYQLAFYMAHFGMQHGRLIYGRIQDTETSLIRTQVEEVKVTIDDGGEVLVGAAYIGFNVDSLMLSAAGLANALKQDAIPPRPIPRGFMGPCKHCPLSAACDRYDAGELSDEEFKAEVPVARAAAKPSTPPKMIRKKKEN